MKLGLIVLLVSLAQVVKADTLPALSCLVNPSQVVDIASPVAGVVEKLYVKKGDSLSKGQKILVLNSDLEKLAVKSAKSQVDFFQRKLKRNDGLLKQNLISAHERDELEMELHQAKLKLNEVKSSLQLKTLKSPLSGVVHQKLVDVGELVTQEPVLQVIQLNPLFVEVVLPQALYSEFRLKQVLQFSAENGGLKQAFSGKVIVKDAIIDAASETFSLRVEVANPNLSILAGLKCSVSR